MLLEIRIEIYGRKKRHGYDEERGLFLITCR